MEDSSTNPFIPQESEAIRQKVYEHQSPLGRIVKWSLIVTVVVAILVGIGLYFVIPKTTAVDQAARVKLANALQSPEQVLKRINVESQLGFKLNYDNNVYSSYAEVGDSAAGTDDSAALASGQTYENNELRVLRAYNYVRIRPVESVEATRSLVTQPPEMEIFATVTDKELTAATAIPENKGLSKLTLFVKKDSDARVAKKVADDKTIVTIDATKPVSSTIGSIEYQKVRYTTTNDNHRVSNVKYDDCYYTIQNDQPYSICITNVRPSNVSAASLVEQVFDSITFEPIATTNATTQSTDTSKKTSYVYPLARLAQATTTTNNPTSSDDTTATDSDTSDESPLITITPSYNTDADSLKSIATTQPSVVRIGTLYCADLALKFESGDTATTLTDACVGNVASGAFVSKDGYVATTGHAIRYQKKAAINGYINFAPDLDSKLDRLQRVIDYLLKSKIILQSDADYLMTGARISDQEALAKVENIASVIPDKFITPVKEEYTYAVQPTEKPIVVNRSDSNKPSFAYSDSVISAKYVASNYDADKSTQETFEDGTPTSDVGLLKVSGDFPTVPIVKTEDVKSNDTLAILGYPAYTDSSLTISKIRNAPVVTTTKVDQVYKKDTGHLIQTNDPILPGNDGAPVVDGTGHLVGFAVYGLSYCPDQLCFANGTVRSSSELTKLLDDNNITLATASPSTQNWDKGVSEYFRANYAVSASAFGTAGSQYPFNRWADPLQKLAVAGQGSTLDTSFMNQLQMIMIISLIVLVVLTIVLAIAYVIHRRRIRYLQVGHYGAATTSPVSDTVTVPIQYGSSPVTPNAPAPQPVYQQPAPQVYQPQVNPQPVQAPQDVQVTQQQYQQPLQPSAQAQPTTPPPEDPFYK